MKEKKEEKRNGGRVIGGTYVQAERKERYYVRVPPGAPWGFYCRG